MSTSVITQPEPATTRAVTASQRAAKVNSFMTPDSFERAMLITDLLVKCGSMPAHIKSTGDAFRIVIQSAKWGIDPYAVAECTSLVHGRLCYEGKLVATVLASYGAIEGHLSFAFSGKGQAMSVVVSGTRRGETEVLTLEGSVSQWRTVTVKDGKTIPNNWDKNPQDMLVYRGTRQWTRIYCPEVLLGVYTRDELEELEDVTATATVLPAAKAPKRRGAKAEPETGTLPPPSAPVVMTAAPAAEPIPATPISETEPNPQVQAPLPLAILDEDLVTESRRLVDTVGEGHANDLLRKICDQIGIKRVQQCPQSQRQNLIDAIREAGGR